MFVEKLLPVDVAPGWSGGPMFSTYVKRMRGGAEFRNRLWQNPLRSYSTRYNHKTKDYLINEIITLLLEVGGAHQAFRARDWSDYQTNDEFVATGDGAAWWFRLNKQYGEYNRRILKPVPTSVVIKIDGNTIDPNGYVVDGVNGTVIFGHAPAAGTRIEWSGEFHVPVRFEEDAIQTAMSTQHHGAVPQFGLLEVREKEDIVESDYETLREYIRAYEGVSWDTLFDVLYRHVNIEWDITQ